MSGGVLSGGYHIPEVIENFLSEDGAASISTTLKAEVDPIQNYGTAQKKVRIPLSIEYNFNRRRLIQCAPGLSAVSSYER